MAEILYSSLLWQTRGLEPYKHKERRLFNGSCGC